MRSSSPRSIVVVACTFLLSVILGCGGMNPVNKTSYEKIKNGMSLSEVESILGKGKEQASSGGSFGGISMEAKGMVWQDGNKIITVMFMNDAVQSKAQMGF
jgi:hypothetical protein